MFLVMKEDGHSDQRTRLEEFLIFTLVSSLVQIKNVESRDYFILLKYISLDIFLINYLR